MTEISPNKPEMGRLERRNLLKLGALAAPLVMTFRSSSAWALSGGCKLLNGTQPIPGTFTVPVPPYNSTPVVINYSVGNIITSSTPLTSDEARFLIDNGNLSLSCYASITLGAGPAGFSTSTSSTSGGSTTTSSTSSGASSGNASSSGASSTSTSSTSSGASSGNASSGGHH